MWTLQPPLIAGKRSADPGKGRGHISVRVLTPTDKLLFQPSLVKHSPSGERLALFRLLRHELVMLPPVPTDSLYKFITVLGIALMVACIASITASDLSRVTELARLDGMLAIHSAKRERLQQIIKSTEKVLDSDPDVVEKMRRHLEEYESLLPSVVELSEDLLTDGQASLAKASALEASSILMWFLFWLGFLITAIGVFCWYFNHQRYQDRMIREQAGGTSPARPAEEGR